MGLLDILNGMQNGPRGSSDPNAKGGMSPMTMAILALLAYKAYQKISQPGAAGGPATAPAPRPGNLAQNDLGGMLSNALGGSSGSSGGGLGDLLKGGLGGLLAGGAAGSVLNGGLGDLLNQLQEKGQGDAANSWVSNEPNKAISANDLASALSPDEIDAVMQQTGLSRNELLAGLAQSLPEAVNQMTPQGRLPTEKEISGWF